MSLSAQSAPTVTLVSPLQTSTQTPNGPADSVTASAGPLGSLVLEQSAITVSAPDVLDASADFGLVGTVTGFFSLAASASVVTAQGPAQAAVGPIDVLIDFDLGAPSFVDVVVETERAFLDGVGIADLSIDIGDDGTIEHQFAAVTPTPGCSDPACFGAAPQVRYTMAAGTTQFCVRVVGDVSVAAASAAEFAVSLFLEPSARCTVVETAPNCGPDWLDLLQSSGFDGSLEFWVPSLAGLQPAPFLVFGFSDLSAPLLLPGPGGACILTPYPDVVAVMTQTGVRAEFSVPFFTSPLAPQPVTFWVQGISVDFGITQVFTTRALRITCP